MLEIGEVDLLVLLRLRHALEPLLHVLHLATQIVDIVLGDAILGAKPAAPLQTAGHEALLGRYHSRVSGTYCVIDDHDGQLNASFHHARQMPQPLIETEAGLRVDDGTGRALLIKPCASTAAARVTAIELVDCGHAETLERLPDHAPSLSDVSAGLVGTYHGHDAAARATIAVTNGELTLTMNGVAGSVSYRLEPVADDIFTFAPAGQMAVMHGVLTAERSGHEATRFRIDTSRTRNLTFMREGGDS